MTKWYRLKLDGYKLQYFPAELEQAMLDKYGEKVSIPEKGAKEYREINSEEGLYIDYGGMCHERMKVEKFELPGTIFYIPARDVELFLQEIIILTPKDDLDRSYYKFYSKWTCVCLLPEHRDLLIPMLKERLENVQEVASKEWEHMHNSITEINKKAGRLVVLPSKRSKMPERN